MMLLFFFLFKQKTAYEMRISDWSSDVCSSDLLEAHVMGGMAPMAVLHAATAGAAETIGRLGDMGTLEPGKYADLIVFDRDPLADIRNTQSLSLVMRGGHLFAADTPDELWPGARALPHDLFACRRPPAGWAPGGGWCPRSSSPKAKM